MPATSHIRQLPCRLDDQEVAMRSKSLSEQIQELELLEDQKKAVAADLKAKIDHTSAEIRKLGRVVRTREETRAVECYERRDDMRLLMIVYRGDTGEVIDSRPMTDIERQERLFKDVSDDKRS